MTAPKPNPPKATSGDDWTTYAHDQFRTGFQAQNVGLSAQTVSGLSLRWSFAAHDAIYASPLAYGGLVIVASANQGVVYALDAKTGTVVWQRNLGGQIRMTPAIDGGQVFVGTHLFTSPSPGVYLPAPSDFYALDLLTGTVRWEVPLAGGARSSAIASSGNVYIGVSGGDPPACIQGGVEALDESSGSVRWAWHVNQQPGQGGAVWAPITYDGSRIIVGTGNVCNAPPVSTANGAVALDAETGRLLWALAAQRNSLVDDDTGGGAMVSNSRVYVINKNGIFYCIDQATGQLVFSEALNPIDSQGGWATPTTDGATILISGGTYNSGLPAASTRTFYVERRRADSSPSTQTGKLFAVNSSGNIAWTFTSQNPIVSYAALNGGLAFVNADNEIVALNLATGAKVWSYTLADITDGGPIVVPSGIYTADNSGNVYAFSLPGQQPPATAKRR